MSGNIGVVSRSDSSACPTKVMLTVLGCRPQPASYAVETPDAAAVEADLAPAALFDLLPAEERPDLLLAICTKRAEQDSWPLLERALSGRCQLKRVEVADGKSRENVAAFLETVTAAVPDDVDLTVDVTHGFRHFSFLTYVAVLYLNALRSVRVQGAYYGLLSGNCEVRFLDLRPLLILPDWIHALRVLSETGSAEPMAESLSNTPKCDSLQRDLSRLSEAYLSGLPLELGMQSDKVLEGLKPLKKALRQELELPLSDELANRLGSTVDRFASRNPSGVSIRKGEIALSEDELKRQARLIDDLLDRRNLGAALGLMNEWTVSWVVLRKGWDGEWLDFKRARRKAACFLGAVAAVVEHHPDLRPRLSSEQVSLGEFWHGLSPMRNAYHHHGMRPQDLVGGQDAKSAADRIRKIREYWHGTLCDVPDFPLSLGGSSGGRVLVSPIGKRPGVLFSALHACRDVGGLPDICLVICSGGSEAGIEEAVGKVDHAGEIVRLRFEDPYGGLGEIERLEAAARPWLLGAEDVLINVTGGTTLMGLAAEQLANAARDLACPSVRRFGLVDRRPPDEQDAKPYVIGEPFWLDCEKAENAN